MSHLASIALCLSSKGKELFAKQLLEFKSNKAFMEFVNSAKTVNNDAVGDILYLWENTDWNTISGNIELVARCIDNNEYLFVYIDNKNNVMDKHGNYIKNGFNISVTYSLAYEMMFDKIVVNNSND